MTSQCFVIYFILDFLPLLLLFIARVNTANNRSKGFEYLWDKFISPSGSETSHKTYSFEAKLKDCEVSIKFVVIFGKWNKDDNTNVHIRITNQLNALAKTIITNYLHRWGIEHYFKELKDTC